jgi:large conductance mechanosensitive channel
MDLAIGVILGAAFGLIVSSLVSDILMPPIGLVTGNVDFSHLQLTLKQAPPDAKIDPASGRPVGEIAIRYGRFINAIINFLIVAFSIFMIVKSLNKMRRKEAAHPETPPAPTKDQILLTEIRDALLRRQP